MQLTKDIISKTRDEILLKYETDFDEQNILYLKGERDRGKFNYNFLKDNYETFDCFGLSLSSLKGVIKDIEDLMKSKKNEIGIRSDYNTSTDEDNVYYEIEVKWSSLRSFDEMKGIIKTAILNKISDIVFEDLQARGYKGYRRYIDCKYIDMFENNAISYDIFIELLYGDCQFT